MAQDAYFLLAFAAVGLAPDGRASWQLAHHVGPEHAFDILTSGERLTAQRCRRYAQAIAGKPRTGSTYAKWVVARAAKLDVGAPISTEAEMQTMVMRGSELAAARRAFADRKMAER